MTLGMLEGIPAVAVLVLWPVAEDCTKIDVGGTIVVIVSNPVGTTEKGAAEEEVVRITAGIIVADDVIATGALLETSVAVLAGKDEAGVPVALTDATEDKTEPVVGPAGAEDKLPEPLPDAVVTTVSDPDAVTLAENGVEPMAVPDSEADDAETVETTPVPEADPDGATLRISDALKVTLALSEMEPVPDTGTMLMGVPLKRDDASEAVDTRGMITIPLEEELTAVPTTFETPEVGVGTASEAVPVAAPVSPELSNGVASADEAGAESALVRSLAEMMVDNPTRMLVGAALEAESVTAGATEVEEGDGCNVIAGNTPVDAAADRASEEEAEITAGIIDSAAEEELGSGDDEGWRTVLGAEPVGAAAAIELEGVVSTRGTIVAALEELAAGTIASGTALVDATESTEAAAADVETSDAGTGVTKAVETITSVEVGLAGTASGRCDCATELETCTTVEAAAGINVSDEVETTSGVVAFTPACRFM
jgi:hypothetical protein